MTPPESMSNELVGSLNVINSRGELSTVVFLGKDATTKPKDWKVVQKHFSLL